MTDDDKYIYTLELTKKQAEILSYACDRMSRIICGQDWTYQEFLEEAWERRCEEATGKAMDEEWDGGWYKMRHDAEEICKQMKKRFWGLEADAMYGIRYDDYADILFDMHRVIRHQIWEDEDDEKSYITVDSEDPTSSIGSEPLAVILKKEKD